MIRVVGRKGYKETSVADVIEEAGTSRTTFYKYFDDKHDCFLAAYEMLVERVFDEVDRQLRRRGDLGGADDWRPDHDRRPLRRSTRSWPGPRRRGRCRRRRCPSAPLERDHPLHRVPRRRPRAGRRQRAAGEHRADGGRRRLRPDLRRAAGRSRRAASRAACPTCCSRCWSPTSGPRRRPPRCAGSPPPITEGRRPGAACRARDAGAP